MKGAVKGAVRPCIACISLRAQFDPDLRAVRVVGTRYAGG